MSISDILLLTLEPYHDEHSITIEVYNQNEFSELLGQRINFVQENHYAFRERVKRGMHYQISRPQAKLVRCILGVVFYVAVDLRRSSPTYAHWVSSVLDSKATSQLWIPEGFAHGFCSMTDRVEYIYKTTNYYNPDDVRCVLWNDEEINIEWPVEHLSCPIKEDHRGVPLKFAELYK